MALQRKEQADEQAVVNGDTDRDRAFSSWLADTEESLRRLFGRRSDPTARRDAARALGRSPDAAWGRDASDKVGSGAKFQPTGEFIELGPYWTRVRDAGRILSKFGYCRPRNSPSVTARKCPASGLVVDFTALRESVRGFDPDRPALAIQSDSVLT